MDEREALHVAARRYCMEHHERWVQRYSESAFDSAHPEAQDIFPRYQVLAAILADVESVVPKDFVTLEDVRGFLLVAGQGAEDMFTRPPKSPLADQAIGEERAAFCRFIQRITPEDLAVVVPLPYRRTLSREEHQVLWTRLYERWGVREGQYWYPLSPEAAPPDALAFQQDWFDHAVPPPVLQHILATHGVARVWELHEYGPEYEITLAQVEPEYGDTEGYWTAGEIDWVIYVSHESSVTVGGSWLTVAVQAVWPEWDQHLYTGWDYRPPPRDGR